MKRLLTILCLLVSFAVHAAPGDILGATIEPNGWVLAVRVAGIATNGAFNFGGVTNYTGWISPILKIPGASVTATVISPGFDQTGASNNVTRFVYGTRQLRCLYGINGQTSFNFVNDVTNQSGDCVIRLAMSHYIFSNDVVSLSIAGNWYSNNNANASVSVTNNSTMGYSATKVVGEFSQPNYDRITANTYTVRAVAFNQFGMNGSTLSCAIFSAKDAHGHTASTTVTKMTWDRNYGDAVPVCEFIATMDASGFTPGDIVTNTVKFYPWIGDTGAVCDTGDGRYTSADPYYGPLYLLADQGNQYGTVRAYVDQSIGTSSGKAVLTNWNFGAEPAPFASISQAVAAIKGTNNLIYGHPDSGGGVVECNGDVDFCGTDGSAGNAAGKTWLTISNAPGRTMRIVSGTGPGNVNNRTKICGATITSQDAFTFSGVSNLWFDGDIFNVTNSSQDLIDGAGFHWVTRCVIQTFDQGFRNQGSQNTVFAMVRGCWNFNTKVAGTDPYCYIGNYYDTLASGVTLLNTERSAIPREVQNEIIAFNKFLRVSNNTVSVLSMHNTIACTNGAVLCQNLFESVGTNGSDAVFSLGSDASTANITNFMDMFNTRLGGKNNQWYNDSGSSPVRRVCCTSKGNLIGDENNKGDTHNGGTGPNAGRDGNQAVYYGVGFVGNVFLEYSTELPSTASGQFINEFIGLFGYQPAITVEGEPSGSTNFRDFPGFISDKTFDGTNGIGDGDYRVLVSSPAHNLAHPGVWMFPVDIKGQTRSTVDPSGADAACSYKKTAACIPN